MAVVIALDSFKGSLSAAKASRALAQGIEEVVPEEEVIVLPIADGGDGLIDCLNESFLAQGWKLQSLWVTGPYSKKVKASYLLKEKSAFIEMARSSGLTLVGNDQKRPLLSTTYGLGEVITDAVNRGATTLYIGLGGSATNDLGLGCMQALGVDLWTEDHQLIAQPFKSGDLLKLKEISTEKFESKFCNVKVVAVCDVSNVLLGEKGATEVFGPQKGLRSEEIWQIESAMIQVAALLKEYFGKDYSETHGAGAAGGMGAALMWFFDAKVENGIDTVLDLLQFENALKKAQFVITGEGSFDEQSLSGKAPLGVLKMAKAHGQSISLVAGRICVSEKTLRDLGFDSFFSIRDIATSDEESFLNAKELLIELGRLWAQKHLKAQKIIN